MFTLSFLGVIPGQDLVFVSQGMQDHIATDPVLPTLGAKIVAMFVIVRIMPFAMERMEAVLALLDTSGKGM